MNTKLLTGIAVAAVAAFAVAWAGAPVVAAQSLIRAANAGDEAKIEALVDFPAFRESLKDELNAEVVARVRRDPDVADSPWVGLGAMLAPMLLSGAVDTLVTPQVIADMVRSAKAPDPTRPSPPGPAEKTAAKPADGDKDDIHQAWGYRDLNHFAVTLTDRDQPDQHLALILERRGLFAWKLAAVDLQSDRN